MSGGEYFGCYMVDEEEYVSWITWFCALKGNEFFCMVDREFIVDDFNLTGLSSMVSFYHYALELILDTESFDGDKLTEDQKRLVESSAETLYGLIHARFITTSRGLKLMEEKFLGGEFGGCPRVFCGGQPVLPVGQSDVIRESSVKLFCPKCEDIYYPRSSRHKTLDGAFWGTTFPHLLLMQLRSSGNVISKSTQHYIPRIYGFRINKGGAEGGRKDSVAQEEEVRAAQVAANNEVILKVLAASKAAVEEDAKGPGNNSGGAPAPNSSDRPAPGAKEATATENI